MQATAARCSVKIVINELGSAGAPGGFQELHGSATSGNEVNWKWKCTTFES